MLDETENIYLELIENLYSVAPEEYWKLDIPALLDINILTNVENILSLELSALVEFVALIEKDLSARSSLRIFCTRMASYAVRIESGEVLSSGLKMLCATPTKDKRDNLITFSLFHHAARKIGIDANALFVQIASALGAITVKKLISRKEKIQEFKVGMFSEACNELIAFAQRKLEDQTIEAMRYEESIGLGGFLFKPDSSWG